MAYDPALEAIAIVCECDEKVNHFSSVGTSKW
jgi:hypothetical protein